ncbi:Putative peroxidase [Parasaccharibacter apium]|uniref:Peroxidase n=1 Tax=Parasaccharibacter apium TaxID=1510841 RepID=A0A7U7G4S0_9PROT|nr:MULTISPECIES: alpha/beta hydrolase [Acetobacteraceae]MCL1512750.1 alpha/beta hydrolase [Parasaccharibacter sp. TMW 2.1891]MUH02099.1 alpha/beta fold hydrolase [Bombella sp. ESL0387]CDG33147.1 Putative peroxidase [Parasaccharibacter apium]
MPYITTSDRVKLHYEDHGQGRPLVMIHGWTFSSRFFHRNVGSFAKQYRVITLDLRGHGESGKPDHGYRIARLAADLRDLLEALEIEDATVLGWSIGSPIIWSYLELFGRHRLRSAIFVQQTPKQFFAPDWKLGHATCYDEAGLTFLQQQLVFNRSAFDRQNLSDCLSTSLPEDEKAMLLEEMAKCPSQAASLMMADHTTQDWRDVLPHLDLPCLMMIAGKDKVLPAAGPRWVAEHMPHCQAVEFENSSHMVFLDETEKFNQTVLTFMKEGAAA